MTGNAVGSFATRGKFLVHSLPTREKSRARPRVDLVVTDVVLPGGMSRPDLAEAVRAQWPGLPVLFTSGCLHYPLARGERPIPELRLLGKPYTIDNLALRCRHAIDAAAHPERASRA